MTTLDKLREQIDKVDAELVAAIAARVKIVKAIGKYKRQHGIAPLQPERWAQVLEDKKELAHKYGLDEDVIVDIYNRLHEYSLLLERKIDDDNNENEN